MSTILGLVLVVTTFGLGAGCAHKNPRARVTVAAINNWDSSQRPSTSDRHHRTFVRVDDTTALNHTPAAWEREARYGQLGMTQPPTPGAPRGALLASVKPCNQTAYFESDSAELSTRAQEKLRQVARCMNLRGARATVVGRTDPSGQSARNIALGAARAEATVDYLESLGVARREISQTSLGESGASASLRIWPTERQARVETDAH